MKMWREGDVEIDIHMTQISRPRCFQPSALASELYAVEPRILKRSVLRCSKS